MLGTLDEHTGRMDVAAKERRTKPVRLEAAEGRNVSLPRDVADGLPAARRQMREDLARDRPGRQERLQAARRYTLQRSGRAGRVA